MILNHSKSIRSVISLYYAQDTITEMHSRDITLLKPQCVGVSKRRAAWVITTIQLDRAALLLYDILVITQ